MLAMVGYCRQVHACVWTCCCIDLISILSVVKREDSDGLHAWSSHSMDVLSILIGPAVDAECTCSVSTMLICWPLSTYWWTVDEEDCSSDGWKLEEFEGVWGVDLNDSTVSQNCTKWTASIVCMKWMKYSKRELCELSVSVVRRSLFRWECIGPLRHGHCSSSLIMVI